MERTPTPGVVPPRKRQNVKIDGSLYIRVQTVADSLGLTLEALIEVGVEAACDKAEQRSKQDLGDFLGFNEPDVTVAS